ncbi:MAG: tetratricopeptide repeat protein [Bacteroidales bacterium]|nr:tetratricopeptide repeat protein [Bacteroidales bacterium]
MSDKNEPVFESEEFLLLLQKYERMKNSDSMTFFDVEEFEQIIDFYLDDFQYEKAGEAAEIGARQHPASVEIKYKVVHVFLEQAMGKKALEKLENIPSWEHSNSEYHYLKGTALCLTGRTQDAEKSFDKGLSLASEDKFEALLNISIAFENARHYQLAIKYLEQAKSLNPEFLSVLYDLGYFYERLDKFDKSIDYYQKYLDIDPFSENVWYNLGVVYHKLDMTEEAIDAYDYSIALNADYASAYFNKANTHAAKSEFLKAIDTIKDFLEVEPDNTQALAFLGEFYENAYQYHKSLESYKRIIEIDNTNTEGWFGAGMILFQLNKFTEATIYLLKALEFDGKNVDFWINLGYIYEEEGKLEEAEKCFKQVILLDKSDYEGWMSLIGVQIRIREYKIALGHVNDALDQFPDDERLMIKSAACHFLLGNEKNGLKNLKKVLISDPSVVDELEASYDVKLWSPAIHNLVKKHK